MEILDIIIFFLPNKKQALKLAIAFRREFVKQRLIPLIPECSMDYASRRGLVSLLDWWKNSGLELKWSERAMDTALWCGNIAVLDWWKNSGREMKWTWVSLRDAIKYLYHGNKALEWWINSGHELKWTEETISMAKKCGNTAVIDWLKKNGY